MARDWERVFTTWSQPPSQTERDKCDNAVRAIRNAVAADKALSSRDIATFAQGSYRNRTNVRADSDVDVCICCNESFFYDLPDNVEAATFGISPATYSWEQYRNDVEQALVARFGRSAVRRGNKAFDIHENTYRIAADAVACFEYRYYFSDGSYIVGTALQPPSGPRIMNFPQPNYDNGVAKNDRTGRSFKSVVRILKRLRNEMLGVPVKSAESIPSFLIECLTWNVPDAGFAHSRWTDDVRYALAHLFNETGAAETCADWTEINGAKILFHEEQPWSRSQVNRFVDEAWNYVGYE